MTEREDDAISARADSFLSELVPQATDRLAAEHAKAYDASAGKVRFEAWLTSTASGSSHEDSRRIRAGRRGTARQPVHAPVLVAWIGAAAAILAAVITGIAAYNPQSGTQQVKIGSPSPTSASSQATQSPSATRGELYAEMTDNHLGTDVFADPMGGEVATGPASIPFGTHVSVKCWAPNESGMASINAFYLVETAPWKGEYAPANTFLNADTTGSLDPKVPECPSG